MSMIMIRHSFMRGSKRAFEDLFVAVRANYVLVLFSVFLILGMILGAIFAKNVSFSALSKLDFLFYSNFKIRAMQSFSSVFSASFASSFLFILFFFLCGLSMWGMFMIPALLFFRGFGLGLTSGYLYAAYGTNGILFNLAVILPGAFICCLAILLAAREGMRFSRRIASYGTSAQSGTISRANVKLYLLRFGAILGIAFLAALIDLFLSTCFAGLFSF
jgi:stage II sporulation protein M